MRRFARRLAGSSGDAVPTRHGALTCKPSGGPRRGAINLGVRRISYARHRFPPVIVQHAVWLYLRFTLSYRDVEDLLAERGIDAS